MSFLAIIRALPVICLLLSVVAAQTCYYPDGLTVSEDVPCNTDTSASSCCPSDSFCMDNGLCFGGGIVKRASCTDQSWESEECADYCKTTSTSTNISLTACSSDSFVCGLNTTQCQTDVDTFTMTGASSLILRPSQITALMKDAQSTSNNGTNGSNEGNGSNGTMYSIGALVGIGLGIGLPLLFSLIVTLFVLRKEKQKNDLMKIFETHIKPVEQVSSMNLHGLQSKPSFASFATVSSSGTTTTINSPAKAQMPAYFMDRYGFNHSQERDLGEPVYELASSPPSSGSKRAEVP